MTFKTFGMIGAALLLTACGAPLPKAEQPGPGPAPAAAQPPAGAAVHRIDPQQSEIRLLVYKAGPMARLGHNHVIVNRAVSGWVSAPGAPAAGAFSMQIPVDAFVVDDRQARAEEGADFAQEVGDEARSGTRRNMLGAALLDAERFPAVTVGSISIAQAQGALTAAVVMTIAGHESRLTIPFALERTAGGIAASGSTVLRQSDMGLTPFSVMLGALQVQDELTVKFRIIAR
jgi:hypothetical protein